MKIAHDKRLHLIGNGLGAAALVALVILGMYFGAWLAAGVGGTAAAWGWECAQKYRGEGTFDPEDAAYGTAASWAVALLAYAAEVAGYLPPPPL